MVKNFFSMSEKFGFLFYFNNSVNIRRKAYDMDNPVQAKRSSGLENNHPHNELRRSSTRFGVDGKR